MKIYLPVNIKDKLLSALIKAGNRETGGILMGEHMGDNEYKIIDLTIQYQNGAFAYFVRHIADAYKALKQFFSRTNHFYTKYNYIGEWHSHPNFQTIPSSEDIKTMTDIVNDQDVGANFAILLIVKLFDGRNLRISGTGFHKDVIFEIEVIMENECE